VNIIAHSKGGLDCRYAIAHLGMGEYVASLTSINTPHRGCLFADYLLKNISEDVQNKVAGVYEGALRKLGDPNPDFLAAVYDLTDAACKERDGQMPIPEGILCQSVGTLLRKARGGRFPLNVTYHLAKLFDGPNDGLVSENSFAWGSRYQLLEPMGRQGISHADIIDLNRENIPGFDVREYYVKLVNALKEQGL
jgi:triacylglycerol lipase